MVRSILVKVRFVSAGMGFSFRVTALRFISKAFRIRFVYTCSLHVAFMFPCPTTIRLQTTSIRPQTTTIRSQTTTISRLYEVIKGPFYRSYKYIHIYMYPDVQSAVPPPRLSLQRSLMFSMRAEFRGAEHLRRFECQVIKNSGESSELAKQL